MHAGVGDQNGAESLEDLGHNVFAKMQAGRHCGNRSILPKAV